MHVLFASLVSLLVLFCGDMSFKGVLGRLANCVTGSCSEKVVLELQWEGAGLTLRSCLTNEGILGLDNNSGVSLLVEGARTRTGSCLMLFVRWYFLIVV